jgi:hypothetical protein
MHKSRAATGEQIRATPLQVGDSLACYVRGAGDDVEPFTEDTKA